MEVARQSQEQPTKEFPLPGLLRPPVIFLVAILLGIALNQAWPVGFVPPGLCWLGAPVSLCAAVLFLLSLREFRAAAGTSVRGSVYSTTILKTGPYRFPRNPTNLAFILFVGGLSVWWNDLWLLVMLVPAVGFIRLVVIPREECFLECNFPEQYLSYKSSVRRWL